MTSNIKVSVIVPVYNVSKYLKRCLDSIIGQTLKEIEIIVVNDCSPDPLDDAIGREYEKLDSRIQYIKHEKNKGPGGARNTGILQAKGVFLGFVDSDDYIHKDMYKVMYEQVIKNDCDFIQCNTDAAFCGKGFDVEDRIRTYLGPNVIMSSGFCDKLIKRSIFLENNVFFREFVKHEDFAPMLKIIFYAKKDLRITNYFHYYYQRENSTTHTFEFDRYKDILLYLKEMRDFLKEKNRYNSVRDEYMRRYEVVVLDLYHKCYKADKNRIREFENVVKREDIYSENKIFRIKFKLFRYVIKMNVFYFVRGVYRLKRMIFSK